MIVEEKAVGQTMHIVFDALIECRIARKIEAAGQRVGTEEVVARIEVQGRAEVEAELGVEERRDDRDRDLENVTDLEVDTETGEHRRGVAQQHVVHQRGVLQERKRQAAADRGKEIARRLGLVLDLVFGVRIGVGLGDFDPLLAVVVILFVVRPVFLAVVGQLDLEAAKLRGVGEPLADRTEIKEQVEELKGELGLAQVVEALFLLRFRKIRVERGGQNAKVDGRDLAEADHLADVAQDRNGRGQEVDRNLERVERVLQRRHRRVDELGEEGTEVEPHALVFKRDRIAELRVLGVGVDEALLDQGVGFDGQVEDPLGGLDIGKLGHQGGIDVEADVGVAVEHRIEFEIGNLEACEALITATAGHVDGHIAGELADRAVTVFLDERGEDPGRALGFQLTVVSTVEHGRDVIQPQLVRCSRIDEEQRGPEVVLEDAEGEIEDPIEREQHLISNAQLGVDQRVFAQRKIEIDALGLTATQGQSETVLAVVLRRRAEDVALDHRSERARERIDHVVGGGLVPQHAAGRHDGETLQRNRDAVGNATGLLFRQLGPDQGDGRRENIAVELPLHLVEVVVEAAVIQDSQVRREQ